MNEASTNYGDGSVGQLLAIQAWGTWAWSPEPTFFFLKKRAMCDGMCLQPQYQGGRGKQIFVVHWPISLDYLLCSRPVKDKYLHPTKDAQGWSVASSRSCACTHACSLCTSSNLLKAWSMVTRRWDLLLAFGDYLALVHKERYTRWIFQIHLILRWEVWGFPQIYLTCQ